MSISITVTEVPTYVTVNETNNTITLNQSDNPISVQTSLQLVKQPTNKTIEIPSLPISQKDNEFKSLKSKIDHTFHEHPGSLDYLWMPTNRKDSLEW